MQNPYRLRRRRGFALPKLIVAVACFLGFVLLAIFFLLPCRPSGPGPKMEARVAMNYITVAVDACYTEYAKFPPLRPPSAPNVLTSRDEWVGDPSLGAPFRTNALTFTLRSLPQGPNEDYAANPRGVVFLEWRSAIISRDGRPRNGIFDSHTYGGPPPPDIDGCLFDPWGHEYIIILDSNGDEQLRPHWDL